MNIDLTKREMKIISRCIISVMASRMMFDIKDSLADEILDISKKLDGYREDKE